MFPPNFVYHLQTKGGIYQVVQLLLVLEEEHGVFRYQYLPRGLLCSAFLLFSKNSSNEESIMRNIFFCVL